MSRVFDGNSANFLSAAGALSVTAPEMTMLLWVKDDRTGGFERVFLGVGASGASGARRWISVKQTFGVSVYFCEGGPALEGSGVADQTWTLLVFRRTSAADWDGFVGATELATANNSANGIGATADDVRLGQTTSGTLPAKGKVAHAAIFTRSLTDQEIADLAAGTNPSTLDATGRYAYYPLTDNSLANAWEADSGVGALTVTGTVANDDADNPSVSAPVVTPTLTLNQTTLTPGGEISGTCTNYSAAPTSPISVSDGTNTDSVAVTVSGTGPYTFTGTMPASPTVAEGSVTVTVGEASTTATYSDGVTAGISALTVQKEGSPVAATDWEIVVNLLSDGTELYNQTAQVSDATGLIGDVSLPTRAVGDTVEVLGYSAANSLWFRFYIDLVNLEA